MKSYVKDPSATLDYIFNWSRWLEEDTIIDSSWTAETGITLVPASDGFTDTTTSVYVSGGTEGNNYTLTNTITTDANRIDERSIEIKIRQR